MILNRISAEIPPETEQKANQAVDSLKEMFPFLVDLSQDERKRLAKMSRKRKDFVDKAIIHTEQNPQFVPQYTDIEEYRKDVNLISALERLYAQLNPFCRTIADTIMAAQAEAYKTARSFYKAVKNAAKHGVEGTEQIIADLSFHFKKQSHRPEGEETAAPASAPVNVEPAG